MNSIHRRIPQVVRTLAWHVFAVGMVSVQLAQADVAPYVADPDTLHLWHLDENTTPCTDTSPGNTSLQSLSGGAALGDASFDGFGTALNTVDDGQSGLSQDAILSALPLASDDSDAVNLQLADSGSGAFTFEAVVRVDFDPTLDMGPFGTGRNSNMQILSGEGDFSLARVFQWRLDPITASSGDAAVPRLEFINLRQQSAIQSVVVPIPTNGPNAIASNHWYHVAVTYDGNEGTADNLRFYWTLMDTNTTAANLIGTGSLDNDLSSAACDFAIGNEARATGDSTDNWIGLIDEVRISGVARATNEFVFRNVAVLGASAIPEPQNPPEATLDGDLNTRWSAQGDGQWITYDLGRAEAVGSVDIAFYFGDTRTATFDVLVSNDNLNWLTALTNATSSGATLDLEPFNLPDDPPARYVRIVGHGNSQSDWNSFTEVAIHHSPIVDTDNDALPDSWEDHYFHNLNYTGTDDPDNDQLSNFYEYRHGFDPTQPTASDDSDNDGLPDAWELAQFGNLAQTGDDDADRDGLSNLVEWQNGSDPTNPNSVTGDIDGDSLPDAWEIANLGNLDSWAYEDPDNDGYNNVAERAGNTSPTNALSHPSWISPRVALLNDSVVTNDACLMPSTSPYGRAINGVSFQKMPILFNGYQYIAWYDTQGTDQSVWLGRRAVNGVTLGPWEMFDTGSNFERGDEYSWDAHNVIAIGISHADGTLHLSWDHHGQNLRYRVSVPGLCTTNLGAWGPGALNPEQDWLVAPGQTVTSVTYPRFINTPSGDLYFIFRRGSTSAGDQWLYAFDPISETWSAGRKFSAKEGTFTGLSLNGGTFTSTSRNGYENGYDFGLDGVLHATWTYREDTPNPCNHDIHYAYSPDDGVTWFNNAGTEIADTDLGEAIRVDSPGIIVKVLNMRQRLINQQAQCVDNDGRVHVLVLHRRVEPGFEWVLGDSAFSTEDTAYYHYFRDPATGEWSQRRLPVDISVGSRPKIGYDAQGNVYAVYVGGYSGNAVPGYTAGNLVVASASKASQYTDWEVEQVIPMDFAGEPLIDEDRLLADNILSVFIQEDSAITSVVGTPLHVFDFVVGVTQPNVSALEQSLNFFGRDVLIVVPGESGHAYQLRMATTLSPANWTNVGSQVSGQDGLLALPDANGRQSGQRFYSVVRDP